MSDFSPGDLARMIVTDFGRAAGHAMSSAVALDLANRIETALRSAIRHERTACARLCEERFRLWESTAEREQTPAALRAEARSRSNEAAYLADAVNART